MTAYPIVQNDRLVDLSPAAGVTTLNFDFPVLATDELRVTRYRDGARLILDEGDDYTLTGVGAAAGGSIALPATLAGDRYLLEGASRHERVSDYLFQKALRFDALNSDMDRLWLALMEHRRDIDRLVAVMPDPYLLAPNTLLGVNSDGDRYELTQVNVNPGSLTVTGPIVDNRLLRFDGNTGLAVQGSPVSLADDGALAGAKSLAFIDGASIVGHANGIHLPTGAIGIGQPPIATQRMRFLLDETIPTLAPTERGAIRIEATIADPLRTDNFRLMSGTINVTTAATGLTTATLTGMQGVWIDLSNSLRFADGGTDLAGHFFVNEFGGNESFGLNVVCKDFSNYPTVVHPSNKAPHTGIELGLTMLGSDVDDHNNGRGGRTGLRVALRAVDQVKQLGLGSLPAEEEALVPPIASISAESPAVVTFTESNHRMRVGDFVKPIDVEGMSNTLFNGQIFYVHNRTATTVTLYHEDTTTPLDNTGNALGTLVGTGGIGTIWIVAEGGQAIYVRPRIQDQSRWRYGVAIVDSYAGWANQIPLKESCIYVHSGGAKRLLEAVGSYVNGIDLRGAAFQNNRAIWLAGNHVLRIGTNDVLGARKTGWGAPTGTATRSTFDTATVTATQLAERVKGLLDDLTIHGLIGA